MARYINEDEFVAWVKEHWCADCQNDNGLRCRACWIDDAIDIVEEAPEADVVPKSEYARLEKAFNELIQEAKGYLNRVYGIRADVASDIFEKVEKIILDNTYPDFNREHRPVNIWKAKEGYDAFDELKKKYTEGE